MIFKRNFADRKESKTLKSQMQARIGLPHTNMNYFGQYENAINILFNQIVEGNYNLDLIAQPFFYLMRHAMELALKQNINYLDKYSRIGIDKKLPGSHNVVELLAGFREQFDALVVKYDVDKETVAEFEKYYQPAERLVKGLGADASAFRYGKDRTGKPVFDPLDERDGMAVKDDFDGASMLLSCTVEALATYTVYEELLQLAPNFTEGIGKVHMRFPAYQKDVIVNHLNELHKRMDTLTWMDRETGEITKILELREECFWLPVKTT